MTAHADLTLWPIRGLEAERIDTELRSIYKKMFATDEEPSSLASLVGVVILDRVNDPAIAIDSAILDLATTIDDSRRVVLAGEIDEVAANLQERHTDSSEGCVEIRV